MQRLVATEDGEGIVSRLKETADGLGELIADHVKLARIELVAEARSYGGGLTALALAAILLVVGYVFACTAGALALGTLVGAPLAFAIVAAPNLIAGAVAAVSAVRKMRQTQILPESSVEAARTVSALSKPLHRTP